MPGESEGAAAPVDPHRGQKVLAGGAPLDAAASAMILVHGRGVGAADILELAREFRAPGLAFLAPEASGDTWYPHSFLSAIESNEPWLSSALSLIEELAGRAARAGIPPESLYFLGFSQGACLSLEYAARHARRYGGVFGLSGGLIGPEGTARDYPGGMDGTPVFLGCSDVDPHIPMARVLRSAEVFERLGAKVTTRLYKNMGHTVNEDEIEAVRSIIAQGAATRTRESGER